MKKLRNYKVGYKKYVESFIAEKRGNNIVNGVRRLSYKKYVERRNDGWTNKDILYGVKDENGKRIKDTSQAILDPAQKKKTWKKYLEARKNFKMGESMVQDETFWGGNSPRSKFNFENAEGLGYHTTLSGLLGSTYGLHFIIANRIISGEDKDDVLSDYGY